MQVKFWKQWADALGVDTQTVKMLVPLSEVDAFNDRLYQQYPDAFVTYKANNETFAKAIDKTKQYMTNQQQLERRMQKALKVDTTNMSLSDNFDVAKVKSRLDAADRKMLEQLGLITSLAMLVYQATNTGKAIASPNLEQSDRLIDLLDSYRDVMQRSVTREYLTQSDLHKVKDRLVDYMRCIGADQNLISATTAGFEPVATNLPQ